MAVDVAFYGQLVLGTALIVGVLSYFLAKHKTAAPKSTAAVGVVLSLFPPIALLFLGILALKKDK